jgi:hypothetical protein
MFTDLTGKKFGRLTVLRRVESRNGQSRWLCRCSCTDATEVIAYAGNLRRGSARSCGCLDFVDLKGRVFTRLTVVEYVGLNKHGSRLWRCRCVCGNEVVVSTHELRARRSRSCGCLMRDLAKERRGKRSHQFKHGRSGTPEYVCWASMITRCTNPRSKSYQDYGGRGIKVCKRWRGEHGFENFLADVGPRPQGKMLDRFPDMNGSYKPGNVRWATIKESNRNTRQVKLTVAKVAQIRALIAQGMSQRGVARKFKVSSSVIWNIAHKRIWTFAELYKLTIKR